MTWMKPGKALATVPGLVVKEVKAFKTTQSALVLQPVETIADVFYLLRSYFNPPLSGIGLTVAVLDTGVAKAISLYREKSFMRPTLLILRMQVMSLATAPRWLLR